MLLPDIFRSVTENPLSLPAIQLIAASLPTFATYFTQTQIDHAVGPVRDRMLVHNGFHDSTSNSRRILAEVEDDKTVSKDEVNKLLMAVSKSDKSADASLANDPVLYELHRLNASKASTFIDDTSF